MIFPLSEKKNIMNSPPSFIYNTVAHIQHSSTMKKQKKREILSFVILFRNPYISFFLLDFIYSISNLSNFSFQSFRTLIKENGNKRMSCIRFLITLRKQKQTPELRKHLEPEQVTLMTYHKLKKYPQSVLHVKPVTHSLLLAFTRSISTILKKKKKGKRSTKRKQLR